MCGVGRVKGGKLCSINIYLSSRVVWQPIKLCPIYKVHEHFIFIIKLHFTTGMHVSLFTITNLLYSSLCFCGLSLCVSMATVTGLKVGQ